MKSLLPSWEFLVWMYHGFVFVFNQFPTNGHLGVHQFFAVINSLLLWHVS